MGTPASPAVVAAAVHTDGTVRCGRAGRGGNVCGARLAKVFGGGPELDSPFNEIGYFSDLGVSFDPGWVQGEDGTWGLSRHAQGRLDRDRWLASGNPGTPDARAAAGRERLREGRTIADRARYKDPGALQWEPPEPRTSQARDFPILIRCWRCSKDRPTVNRLDRDRAQAVAPRPGSAW